MSIEENIENLRRFKNIKVLYGKYTMTNEQLSGLRQSIGNVLDELDKKDKVIDLMAKWIGNNKIYERKEEYRRLMSTFNKDIKNNSETLYNVHINCIKQYFYKKVEGERKC